MTVKTAPQLPADLVAGLRRLKLFTMRQLAPELLLTAKTQRWTPRGGAADVGGGRGRLPRRLERRRPAQSGHVPRREDHRGVRHQRLHDPARHVLMTGLPDVAGMDPRTGEHRPHRTRRHREVPHPDRARPRRRHRGIQGQIRRRRRPRRDPLPGVGRQQRRQVHRGPPTQRPDPGRLGAPPAPRGRSGSPRSTTPARSCCSASSPLPTNADPSASPRTGRSRTGAGSCPNTPPPSASSTGSCTTPPPWSPPASPTGCTTPKPGQEAAPAPRNHRKGWGLSVGHQRGLRYGH